jgi:hypothetical protein
MSLHVLTAVWEHAPHKEGTLLVLLALADWADETGYCFPGIDSIAKKSRVSRRQVIRILKRLIASGDVTLIKKGGKNRGSNKYKVNVTNWHLGATQGDNRSTQGDIGDTSMCQALAPEPSENRQNEPSGNSGDIQAVVESEPKRRVRGFLNHS